MTATNQHETQALPSGNWYQRQVDAFERGRLAWLSIYIIAHSCWGSIACMYVLLNNANVAQLAICAGVVMASNAMFIAQAPAKWCINVFYLSIVLNTIILLINIF